MSKTIHLKKECLSTSGTGMTGHMPAHLVIVSKYNSKHNPLKEPNGNLDY